MMMIGVLSIGYLRGGMNSAPDEKLAFIIHSLPKPSIKHLKIKGI
jgi:hypothetical protein